MIYAINDHGVEHSQYWQGHGIALTDYTTCATGIGHSYWSAFECALEDLAQQDIDINLDKIEAEHKAELKRDGDWDRANTDMVEEWVKGFLENPNDEEELEEALCETECLYFVSVDVREE